ncbi:hypothetical protein [Bradyrhizobium algeriense]|nr:hypothetical protein [Bradyrhizobium algeriense]
MCGFARLYGYQIGVIANNVCCSATVR